MSVGEWSARSEGMSKCSAALFGSSAEAAASDAVSGVSNTRSTTRSPVVHRQVRSASQPMMSICGITRRYMRESIAEAEEGRPHEKRQSDWIVYLLGKGSIPLDSEGSLRQHAPRRLIHDFDGI